MSGLSEFTVELDIYSGPYEWLLAMILHEELEIFEVPLAELVGLYRSSYSDGLLERDVSFADSATSLVLLKSRALLPSTEAQSEGEEDGDALSADELAERLRRYLMVRRGAQLLGERMSDNLRSYPTGHDLSPRPGALRVDRRRLLYAARRVFSRAIEPSTRHMATITVTVEELASLIKSSLRGQPLSFDELVADMDRVHRAVAFAATVSMYSRGEISVRQSTHLGPITLESVR